MKVLRLAAITALFTLSLCASAQQNTGHVHFYRYKQGLGKALHPSVYCDGVQLARMEDGRFFDIEIPAGTHIFTSEDPQAGLQVTIESGKDYYFRVDLTQGFWKGHGRLTAVLPDQGRFEMTQMKPVDASRVVTTTLPAAHP